MKQKGVLGPRTKNFSRSQLRDIRSRLRFGESKYVLAKEYKTSPNVIETIGAG